MVLIKNLSRSLYKISVFESEKYILETEIPKYSFQKNCIFQNFSSWNIKLQFKKLY